MSESDRWNQSSPPRRETVAERVRGVVPDPPAPRRVDQPGQGVRDRVEVGRDVQAEQLDVVGDVADHGDVPRRHDLHEPVEEAGGADAAREHGHDHGAIL